MKIADEESIDLKEWWEAAWKKRFLFVALFILINALTLTFSFFVRNQYKTSVTFFITSTQSTLGLSQLSGLIGMGLDPTKPSIDQLIGIIGSRQLAKKVIGNVGADKIAADFHFVGDNKQDLTAQDLNDMADDLKKKVSVRSTKQFLTLDVAAFSPQMTVVLANAYLDELGRYLNEASLNFNFHLLDEPLKPKSRFAPSLRKNVSFSSLLVFAIFIAYVVGEKKLRAGFFKKSNKD